MKGSLGICLVAALLLAGCTATVAQKPVRPESSRVEKAPIKPAPVIPRAEHCGPAMDTKVWKVQCSQGDLAMMCRKSDPTDRRCAYKRSGKYRWTYGSYCHRSLACYKRACR
ncbi:MAG TPA: hypothetical protein VN634_19180 [Candidatus Limnocylindrales bacterium]|jgi:hypothetical protein|nr:hypothetical protein [Candidatus Limnocylindrales bacterium]